MTLITQQTKVDDALVLALKKLAKEQGITLQALYADAVQRFLNERAKTPTVLYLVSPRTGGNYNLKLPAPLVRRAITLATKDHTSARRLYYTALVRYAQAHGLLPANL